MLITDKIPSCIYEALSLHGVDADKIMLATYCDMNADHVFCDTYVFATLDMLYVVSGSGGLESEGQGIGKLESVWREESLPIP